MNEIAKTLDKMYLEYSNLTNAKTKKALTSINSLEEYQLVTEKV